MEDEVLHASGIRCLNELEEAVGRLDAVSVDRDSLLVIMDSAQFAIEFPTIQKLNSARQALARHIGRKVAILHLGDSAKPLHIHLATPDRRDKR